MDDSFSLFSFTKTPCAPKAVGEVEYSYLENEHYASEFERHLDAIPAAGEFDMFLVMYQIRRDLGSAAPYLLFFMVPDQTGSACTFPSFAFAKPGGARDVQRISLVNESLRAAETLVDSVSSKDRAAGKYGRAKFLRGVHSDPTAGSFVFLDMSEFGFAHLARGFSVCVDELLNQQRAGPNRLPVNQDIVNAFLHTPRLAFLIDSNQVLTNVLATAAPVPQCMHRADCPDAGTMIRNDTECVQNGEIGTGFYFHFDFLIPAVRYLVLPCSPVYPLPDDPASDGDEESQSVYFVSRQSGKATWKVPTRQCFRKM